VFGYGYTVCQAVYGQFLFNLGLNCHLTRPSDLSSDFPQLYRTISRAGGQCLPVR
jgi:hypothetical protein